MSDPEYVPHRLVLGRPRKPGEPRSEFGKPGPTEWTLPRGTANTAHLRGAVLHHLYLLGLRRATARTNTPVEDLAAAAGRTQQEWTRVLGGQVLMRLTDAAAICLAGPDAVPPARESHATLARVSADVDDELAVRIAAAAGDPSAFEDRAVMKALGAPMVHAQRPLGPDDQRGLRDARKGLMGLLDATVATLTSSRGLPVDYATAVEADVDATHHGEAAGAGGYADPGSLVSLTVHPTWADNVERPGWAVLDERLVLDVRVLGTDGRPTRVDVLDLQPDWNGPAHDYGTPPPWGWAYQASLATVAWDDGQPTVTVDDPQG